MENEEPVIPMKIWSLERSESLPVVKIIRVSKCVSLFVLEDGSIYPTVSNFDSIIPREEARGLAWALLRETKDD